MKILVVSSAEKYSAIWRYAYEVSKCFRKKNKVKWLDLYDRNEIKRAKKLFEKTEGTYDVAIFTSPLLGSLIKKTDSKLKIVIVHDIYPLSVGKGTKLAVKILAAKTYKETEKADVLLFVSKFSKKEFAEHFSFHTLSYVLPGGMDHKIFRPSKAKKSLREKYKIDQKKFVICHVGTNDYRKNTPFLMEVFQKLKNVHLVKVGNLKGNSENITVIKKATDKELAEIYNMSDLFLFPSIHEGLGLPPLEAMACGCPALVSDKGALEEFGLDESVTKLNVKNWVDKINKVKNNAKYRKLLVKKGIQRSKDFDWKRYCSVLEKIIENTLEDYEKF